MRAYEEYKQIGLPWLDRIPAHWKVQRAKNMFKKMNRPASESDEVITCFRDGEVTLRSNRRTTGFTESLKEIGYQGIHKGDLVIHVMDAFAGAVGVSDSDGKGTPVYSVCTPKGDYNNYYYANIIRIMAKTGYIQSLYRGIRERSSDFRFEVFADQYLPIPPREEQDAIVRFLDAKCAKIDSLIKLKERQIALLNEKKQSIINQAVTKGLDPNAPMKDSGVDYIGMIPSHWQVILNHRLWEEKTRGYSTTETVLSLSQQDGVVPYEDMTERSLHTSSYDNWKLVFPGDLVVNRFKAHLGVFFSSAYRGIVTFHYGVFQFKMNGSTKYYEYLYHTPKFCQVYASLSNGMTVGLQNLSNSHFYGAYSVYPPVHEQKEIVDKIETINVIYRNKIKIIENEILILHEYKMKLISDVVTGKINILYTEY